MFIGHFAVGFAFKRLAPRAQLGLLMTAPLLLDLLWPIGLLTGLESVRIDPGNTVVTPLDLHDYPYSHSLLMALVWSLLIGAATLAWSRDRRTALVMTLGVFSHWVLDFISHRPDMPLYPGSETYLGLGLWNSRVGTLVVEATLFAVGVYLYASGTRAKNRTGAITLWALVVLLAVGYLGNLYGPPPPSAHAIALAGLSTWLFVVWAWWIDRNRAMRTS